MFCSPSNNNNKLNNSCFTENQILKIVKSFNQNTSKNNKINTFNRDIYSIYQELKTKLNNIDEYLWVENSKNTKYLSKSEIGTIFIPKMPSEWCQNISSWRQQTNNSLINAPWLSNFDIDDVLAQYQNKYPNFIFLGTFPIDFQTYNLFGCVSNLCNFNLRNIISKKKYYFGLVLNTDKHNQSGSHWISIFCSLKAKKIYYFNSATNHKHKIPKPVLDFVDDIQKQFFNIYKRQLSFRFNNKVQHQSSNSECGIYSIYFILSMLDASGNNNNPDTIFEQYFNNPMFKIQDSTMLNKRFKLFRPNSKCPF